MLLRPALWALALLPVVAKEDGDKARQAPSYAASSAVNLASGRPFGIAPNTLVALMGRDLSFSTRARQDSDLSGGVLPVTLPGTGVTVTVNGLLTPVEYVSPEVVVFAIPAEFAPGPASIVLARNGIAGPAVRVDLQQYAPALFESSNGWVLARHASSLRWVSETEPATPSEVVIFYATGLGPTIPPQLSRRAPRAPSPLADPSLLAVRVGGNSVSPDQISYAGATEGLPGMYEIRVKLADSTQDDPEVELGMGEMADTRILRLPLRNQLPPRHVQ
ncbi:MAG: hypothetical protein HY858_12215 [Candidatus Solibacter usitatus]|nr:hypothetical protein [Candidatus Solibacter usitatus]